jgi:hypothetical protein
MGRPLKIRKTNNTTPIDSGFDNPTGNSYGTVGGLVSQSGQQVLARVALGRELIGLYITSGEANIGAVGVDLGNTVGFVDTSRLETTDGVAIGVVDSTPVQVIATTVSTAASTDLVTVDDTTGFLLNIPVVFGANIGGLVAGAVYFIKTIDSGTTFSVSATPGGAVVPLSDATVATTATVSGCTLATAPNVTITGSAVVFSKDREGSILRQKGKKKYLVTENTALVPTAIVAGESYLIVSVGDTDWEAIGAGPDAAVGKVFVATATPGVTGSAGTVSRVGICTTANLANANLTANTMNMVATKADANTVFLNTLTNYKAVDFTDNGNLENAGTRYIASFNGAAAAPAGTTYPIVDISSS